MNLANHELDPHIEERVKHFSEEVVQAAQRIHGFRDIDPEDELDPETFRAALGELQAQYEELCIADEELRAQVDELARVSVKRDVERQRYRELFDFAPDPYFVTNSWGLIVDANVAATALLDIEHRHLRGKPLATLIERDDITRFRDMLAVVQNSARVELEVRLKSKAGSDILVTLVGARGEDSDRILWTARSNPKSVFATTVLERSTPDAQIDALARALVERDEKLAMERRLREDLRRPTVPKITSSPCWLTIFAHR